MAYVEVLPFGMNCDCYLSVVKKHGNYIKENHMKKLTFNKFILPVAAGLLSSTIVLAADNHPAQKESNEIMQGWQETKRDAAEYWGDFKQDAKQTWGNSKEAFRDGWVEGKLQSVLLMSDYIDVNDIDIDVSDYIATLTGTVESEVSRELAEELAKGVEGINEVVNKLELKKTKKTAAENISESKGSVGEYVTNSILTAELKYALLKSKSVPAMDLDLTVRRSVVILEGKVDSEGVKELAEKIVMNHSDVREVINKIEVAS